MMLSGAIRRMRQRQLSAAFEKWQYEAASTKAERAAMSGAVGRLLNRLLSMAFEKWQCEAAEMKR